MPVYVYRCQHCDAADIDVSHTMLQNPTIICPDCGNTRNRVPQATGIALKGDGWAGKTSNGGAL